MVFEITFTVEDIREDEGEVDFRVTGNQKVITLKLPRSVIDALKERQLKDYSFLLPSKD